MNDPTGCWQRNLSPPSWRPLSASHSARSAGVMLQRRCRAFAATPEVVPRMASRSRSVMPPPTGQVAPVPLAERAGGLDVAQGIEDLLPGGAGVARQVGVDRREDLPRERRLAARRGGVAPPV